jgi:hypothetical protein
MITLTTTDAPSLIPTPVDPATLRPSVPYPSSFPSVDVHELGIAPPALRDASGRLRPVQAWAAELAADPMAALYQVGAALYHGQGAAYQYILYGANITRPTLNEGLKKGGGECDWFTLVAYEALTKSGRFRREDVVIMQVYADGGWHNVVAFRNPKTRRWDVLDYSNVVSVGADSPQAAMRSYFRNHELGVLYRADDPNARASIVSRVRSDNQATATGFLARPGLSGAMSPAFGSVSGLNEGGSAANVQRDATLGAVSSGLRVENGGAVVDARVGQGGFDRVGVSSTSTTAGNNLVGVKGLLVRDSGGGGGVNLFVGGEWWHLRAGSYLGVVAGTEARFAISTERLQGQTLTTIAPLVAVQGGGNKTAARQGSTALDVFWNARLQLGAPLVLNAAVRPQVQKQGNSITGGGVLDPGFLGLANGGGNAGASLRTRLSDRWSMQARAALRIEGQDPTINGWPIGAGAELDARFHYRGDGLSAAIGGSGGVGLYDRDVLWSLQGSVNHALSAGTQLGLQAGFGQYWSKEAFALLSGGVTHRLGDGAVLSVGAGVTATRAPEAPPRIAPVLGISISR